MRLKPKTFPVKILNIQYRSLKDIGDLFSHYAYSGKVESKKEIAERKSLSFTKEDLKLAAEKFKNWGKWGSDDEIGTLNYTSPEDIIKASQLVKKGKVISRILMNEEILKLRKTKESCKKLTIGQKTRRIFMRI